MVIVDSSVWIDYLQGKDTPHTRYLDRLAGVQEIGLVDVVLFEVLQGIKQRSVFDKVKSKLLSFTVFSVGGAQLALDAAENSIRLREKGVCVSTVDCLLATFCLQGGFELLTTDKNFQHYAHHLGLLLPVCY
ncbi:MAG: PIN domain-containing protein [bacterium]|nr:PIN domain-containing protein [bacterium]